MANFIEVDSESHGKVIINKQHIVLVLDMGDGSVSISLIDIERPILVRQTIKDVKSVLD